MDGLYEGYWEFKRFYIKKKPLIVAASVIAGIFVFIMTVVIPYVKEKSAADENETVSVTGETEADDNVNEAFTFQEFETEEQKYGIFSMRRGGASMHLRTGSVGAHDLAGKSGYVYDAGG